MPVRALYLDPRAGAMERVTEAPDGAGQPSCFSASLKTCFFSFCQVSESFLLWHFTQPSFRADYKLLEVVPKVLVFLTPKPSIGIPQRRYLENAYKIDQRSRTNGCWLLF